MTTSHALEAKYEAEDKETKEETISNLVVIFSLQTADCKLQTASCRLQAADCRPQSTPPKKKKVIKIHFAAVFS